MSARKSDLIIPKDVFCDFCGRTTEKIGSLIRSSFGVHICYDCAVYCAAQIKAAEEKGNDADQ